MGRRTHLAGSSRNRYEGSSDALSTHQLTPSLHHSNAIVSRSTPPSPAGGTHLGATCTYSPLPTTSHLLPTAHFQPPTTHSPLPTTYYLLPATCYLLPGTWYLLPATCDLLPATYHLLPTTYYLLPATCYLPPTTCDSTLPTQYHAPLRSEEAGHVLAQNDTGQPQQPHLVST